MEIREFAEKLAEKMQSLDTSGTSYTVYEAVKANFKGWAIQSAYEDANVAPVIYPYSYFDRYRAGEDMEKLAKEALVIIEKAHQGMQDFDIEKLLSADYIKEHCYFEIVNARNNSSLAENCTYASKLDLIALPKVRVDFKQDSFGAISINKYLQQNYLRMTDEELLGACQVKLNSEQFEVKSLIGVIHEMKSDVEFSDDFVDDILPAKNSAYVVTNLQKIGGANILFSTVKLDEVCRTVGFEEVFIIPSSRHEVLFMNPKMVEDPAQLQQMCKEVNENFVEEEDFLSDNIYHYDIRTHQLNLCNSLQELEKIHEQMDEAQSIAADIIESHARRM